MRSSLIAAFMVVPTYFLASRGMEPAFAVLIVVSTMVGLALSVILVVTWLTNEPSEVWKEVRIGLAEGLKPWGELWRFICEKTRVK